MKIFLKKIAKILGNNFPYFKGKMRIIYFLFSPKYAKKNNEKFLIKYFNKKYEGEIGNYIDWGVYFLGGLEKGLINYLNTEINSFNYFLDIGSNSGSISLPFADKKNLKIICFEPLELNYKKLINNYKINNLYEKHIFHKIALSNKNHESFIHYSSSDPNKGTSSLIDGHYYTHDSKEKVNIRRLDDLYKFKNEKIIIKIDVEGHEREVIEGMSNILQENRVLVYLETTQKNLIKYLKKKNFKILFPKFVEGNFEFTEKQNYHDVILKNC